MGQLLAGQGLSILLGIAFWVIVARLYPIADVGLASATLAAALLASALATLGLNYALLRYLASEPDREGALSGAASVATFASVLIASIALLAPGSPAARMSTHPGLVWFVFSATAVVFTHQLLVDAALVAMNQTQAVLRRYVATAMLRIGLAIMLQPLGALGLVGAWAAATSIVMLWTRWRQSRLDINGVFRLGISQVPQVRQYVRFAASNYLANILSSLPALLFPWLLLAYLGAEVTGRFAVVWQIATMVALLPTVVATVLVANAGHSGARGVHDVLRTFRPTMLLVGLAATTTAIAAPTALRILGSAYVGAGPALGWLLIALIPGAINSHFQALERAKGRTASIVLLSVATAALPLGLTVPLLPVASEQAPGIALVIGAGIPAAWALRLIVKERAMLHGPFGSAVGNGA